MTAQCRVVRTSMMRHTYEFPLPKIGALCCVPRACAHMVTDNNGTLWLIGGYSDITAPFDQCEQVERWHASTGTWTIVSTAQMADHVMAVTMDRSSNTIIMMVGAREVDVNESTGALTPKQRAIPYAQPFRCYPCDTAVMAITLVNGWLKCPVRLPCVPRAGSIADVAAAAGVVPVVAPPPLYTVDDCEGRGSLSTLICDDSGICHLDDGHQNDAIACSWYRHTRDIVQSAISKIGLPRRDDDDDVHMDGYMHLQRSHDQQGQHVFPYSSNNPQSRRKDRAPHQT